MGPPTTFDETSQTIAVVSLTGISLLIIAIPLQTKFHVGCWKGFKEGQLGHASGRTLFIIFAVALCLTLTNCINFTQEEFSEDTSFDDHYTAILVSRCLYDMNKWCTSLFFILRLNFVLEQMESLRVSKWILALLITMTTASLLLTVISNVGAIFDVIELSKTRSVVAYSMSMAVDITVMVLYVRRLVTVVIDRAKIETLAMSPLSTDSSHDEDSSGSSDGDLQNCGSGKGDTRQRQEVTVSGTMIYLITKSTLLSVIGMSSSCLVIVYLFISITVGAGKIGPSLGTSLRCLDGVINVVCMYLVFGFNAMFYRSGCKGCHYVVAKCCSRMSKKAVVKMRSTSK